MLLYKPPAEHSMITPEELKYITDGQKELQANESGSIKNVWKLSSWPAEFLGHRLGKISF